MKRVLLLAALASSLLLLSQTVASAQYPGPLTNGRLGSAPSQLGGGAARAWQTANNASRFTGVQINSRTTATVSPSGVTFQHEGRSSRTTIHAGSVQPWGSANRSGVGVGVNIRWK